MTYANKKKKNKKPAQNGGVQEGTVLYPCGALAYEEKVKPIDKEVVVGRHDEIN